MQPALGSSINPDKTNVVNGNTLCHGYYSQQGGTLWLRPDRHLRSYGSPHQDLAHATRLFHGAPLIGERVKTQSLQLCIGSWVCLLTLSASVSKKGPVIPPQPTTANRSSRSKWLQDIATTSRKKTNSRSRTN